MLLATEAREQTDNIIQTHITKELKHLEERITQHIENGDYEFSFDKISKLEYRDGGATTGADLSALSKIVFDPRGAKGNIVIASITVQ